MSLISGFKLQVEEYASQAEWIERLLRPLNNFAQSTVNAVNGNLSIGQNVTASYRTIRAQIPSLPWVDLTPQSGWTNVTNAPIGYWVEPDGTVNLRGRLSAGTKTDGTTIFTVPAALRPEYDIRLTIPHDDKNVAQGLLSATDGTMKIYNVTGAAATLFFTGIYYFASNPPAQPAYVGHDWPIKLSTGFATTVAGVVLTQAIDIETNEKLSAGTAGIDWVSTARNEVTVKRVNGLTPKRTYDLTFLIIGA